MAITANSSLNFPMEFEFEDTDVINIPNNGIVYSVTWRALKLSEMIASSFQDVFFADIQLDNLGETLTPEFIINVEQTEEGIKKTVTLIGESYNTIEGPVFKIVIDMIQYYSENGLFHETAFKDIHHISMKMLFDVYKAANFFNIPTLLDGCANYIANLIKNKTKNEIEQIFSQPEDTVVQDEIVEETAEVEPEFVETVIVQAPIFVQAPIIVQDTIIDNEPMIVDEPIIADEPIIDDEPMIIQNIIIFNEPYIEQSSDVDELSESLVTIELN